MDSGMVLSVVIIILISFGLGMYVGASEAEERYMRKLALIVQSLEHNDVA